jgi:hypothetical protein
MMEAVCSSEKMAHSQNSTWHNNLEDHLQTCHFFTNQFTSDDKYYLHSRIQTYQPWAETNRKLKITTQESYVIKLTQVHEYILQTANMKENISLCSLSHTSI